MASLKIYNHEYAPGIATYGMIGERGTAGTNGNSMFYTSYDIYGNNKANMEMFLQKLRGSMLPVHNSTVVLNRKYQNGDYFFDNAGHVYRLTNAEDIYTANSTSFVWSNYLTLCGNINTSSTQSYVSKNDAGRLNLNDDYQGLDIISNNTGYSMDSETSYAIRIMSDNPNNENNVNFIKLSSIYTENLDNQMNIYFDSGLNAFHINTDGPLLLDGQVRVLNNQTDDAMIDGYSKVVIHETPITSFYNLCQHIKFKFVRSELDQGKIDIMQMICDVIPGDTNVDIFWNLIKDKITAKILFTATYEPMDKLNADYDHSLESEVSHIYMQKLYDMFDLKNNNWSQTYNKDETVIKAMNFVTKFHDYDLNIMAVSLIYNTEIFILTEFI